MSDADYLRNQFLIAMPGMADGYFNHTVTLLCEHTPEGAMGLVLNRPTDLSLSQMLAHMDLEKGAGQEQDQQVFWGGPVQPERGFVLHSEKGDWESTLPISDDLFLTTSRDILEAVAQHQGPRDFLVTLGYAGWGAGQLEHEILQNSWLSTQSSNQIIFATDPAQRWQASIGLLGLNPADISGEAGHA